jgi:hypothetical protein
MQQGGKPRVADFVHGSDGLGHVDLPDPTSKQIEQSAAEFLVDKVFQFPGEVSVLALGPLTNVALVCLTSSDAVESGPFQTTVRYDPSTFCFRQSRRIPLLRARLRR